MFDAISVNRFEGRDGEQTMLALCIEGLMDVADSVAVSSVFPSALTTALLEKFRRGDERGLLSEQHYLDWVSSEWDLRNQRIFPLFNLKDFVFIVLNLEFLLGA